MRKILGLGIAVLLIAITVSNVTAYTPYETEASYNCVHDNYPIETTILSVWYEPLNDKQHKEHQIFSSYCTNCYYEMEVGEKSYIMPHVYDGKAAFCGFCWYEKRATDTISVVVNGTEVIFDVPPQIINGRTMVPVRAIFEALGADVYWDDATKTVYAEKPESDWVPYVKLTIGGNIMEGSYVGNSYWLESPATMIDGRTLVPARAAAEGFGHIVEWDESTRTVYIGY